MSEVAEFDFTLKYRPGVVNKDADCLSRLPLDINHYQKLCTQDIRPDAFKEVGHSCSAHATAHIILDYSGLSKFPNREKS